MDKRPALVILTLAILASACTGGRVAVGPGSNEGWARPELVATFTDLPPATDTLTPLPTSVPTQDYATATPDQFEAAGLPVRLEMPAIGVDALVEHVGRLPNGDMDTPDVPRDVAWFNESALPGQYSSKTSIMNGHLDSPAGPAVFFALRQLIPGDEIAVTYSNGDRYVFEVVEKERYYYDQAPLQKLYGDGETTGRRLNLITCDGAWDRGQANYSQRLVVYTRLKSTGVPRALSSTTSTPTAPGTVATSPSTPVTTAGPAATRASTPVAATSTVGTGGP